MATSDARPEYDRSLTNQIASLSSDPNILLPTRSTSNKSQSQSQPFSPALTPPLTPSPPPPASIYAHIASSPDHARLLSELHDVLGQPISSLLREGTKKAHTLAEHSDGARALIGGTLGEGEYLRYLVVLWLMYKALEDALDRVAEGRLGGVGGEEGQGGVNVKGIDGVQGLWKRRRLLYRTRGLESDIRTFTARLSTSHPSSFPSASLSIPFPLPTYLHPLLTAPPEPIKAYITRLAHLSTQEPGRLIAHAYVRYLGDLSGGQLVAQRIKRTYHLGAAGNGHEAADVGGSGGLFPPGTKFYEFDFDDQEGEVGSHSFTSELGDADPKAGLRDERATLKENIEEVKGWFRETMDLAVGDDEELKASLVDEAITAFQLLTNLFSLLIPPEKIQEPVSPALTPPDEKAILRKSHGDQKEREVDATSARRTSSLESSLSSAKFLIALQLVSRLVTFSLNQALVRMASPTVFGTAAVQFDLIRDTLLFLSREAVRGVVTRMAGNSESSGGARSPSQLRNLLLLPAVLGLVLVSSALPLYLGSLPLAVTSQTSFYPSLLLCILSTIIELGIVEPISLYAQYLSSDSARGVKVRVRAEGSAVIVRAGATVSWLAAARYLSAERQSDGKALLGFGVGQLGYGLVLAWVHVRAYWSDQQLWSIFGSQKSEIAEKHALGASPALLDEPSRNLFFALSGQSLVKHLLTTGDMMVVARTSPLKDQGGYAIASNYASLVARIVFQPVEESSRLYFAKSLPGADPSRPSSALVTPFLLLTCLVRTSLFLLLLTPTFVPPLLPLLLPYLLPQKYLDTSAPRALHAYLTVYLPIMALNGILEAFFSATTTVNGVVGQSGAMIACSAVFAGTIGLFSSARNGQVSSMLPRSVRGMVPALESGLVYANAVQMSCRIAFAGLYAWRMAGSKLHGLGAERQIKRGILPRWRTSAAVAMAFIVVRTVESILSWRDRLIMRAAVIGVSGAAGLACLGAFYLDEKHDWKRIARSGEKKDN